ncbi:winged helix DNA-binding domain-containing protein [Fodinicola acaciae]|uniref:winged helix DNA-binding domain-containing protein n=1 Tax=Fodinicola acaciae TaxID=2681555 RepID=UPI0013D2A3BB|nr:winged helix DNA-binding domain-containing protein [Fodinicola acaciae]
MRVRVVSRRELNRALLERQLLLKRTKSTAKKVIDRLVGMQAQATNPPYHGLWSRIAGFRRDDLTKLIERRQVVRGATLRSTLHLHTAADFLAVRAVMQATMEKSLIATFGKVMDGVDLDTYATVGRALLEEKPLTFGEIRDGMLAQWPGRHPSMVTNVVRTRVPLIQVPPCGTWDRSGPRVYTSVESWLGGSVPDKADVESLVFRYLAAFGPATVADMQNWSGLTRLGEVARAMPLRRLRAEDGAELFDTPKGKIPSPEVPAPVRLVAEYDNVVLGHADRSRIIADEHRRAYITVNGIVRGTVLVDGFVAALWRMQRKKATATVTIEPLRKLSTAERDDIEPEALALLRFTDPAASHQVTFGAT